MGSCRVGMDSEAGQEWVGRGGGAGDDTGVRDKLGPGSRTLLGLETLSVVAEVSSGRVGVAVASRPGWPLGWG